MKKNIIIKTIKLMILILLISITIFLAIKFMPLFKQLATSQGRSDFKDFISNMGIKGLFIMIGLIILQLIISILPGEPLEILAGMCYGTIGGMIVMFIGTFLSSTLVYLLVKKFGRNFIYTFVSKEKLEKIENSKLFKNKTKIEYITFILFFIPGTPKDLLTYMGGLLPIKATRFLIICTFARFPSIITSTFAGANIANGNWKITIITFIVTFFISLLGIILINIFQGKKLSIKGSNS